MIPLRFSLAFALAFMFPISLGFAFSGCQPPLDPDAPDDSKPPPVDSADGGDVDRYGCAKACARIVELKCGDAADCVAACENIEQLHAAGESDFSFAPACVAKSATCAEADGC